MSIRNTDSERAIEMASEVPESGKKRGQTVQVIISPYRWGEGERKRWRKVQP